MKVMITGGHLTPALALIEELENQDDTCIFIGHHHTTKPHLQRERQLIEAKHIPFIGLKTVKWNRYRLSSLILELPQLLIVINHARRILLHYRPDVVVGFGGYLTLPLAVAASLTRTKLVIHEQTTKAGVANRLAARFAHSIAISYSSSRSFFPRHKTHLTGNLLQQVFFISAPKPRKFHALSSPFLLFTGGSQGSRIINMTLNAVAPTLLKEYTIVHQYGNDAPVVSATHHPSYYAYSWFNPSEMAYLLQQTMCVVSRAGANTVSEIIAAKTPAILIPLKGSQQNEQAINATLITQSQSGLVIDQDLLTPTTLMAAIKDIVNKQSQYKRKAQANTASADPNAVKKLYQLLQS